MWPTVRVRSFWPRPCAVLETRGAVMILKQGRGPPLTLRSDEVSVSTRALSPRAEMRRCLHLTPTETPRNRVTQRNPTAPDVTQADEAANYSRPCDTHQTFDRSANRGRVPRSANVPSSAGDENAGVRVTRAPNWSPGSSDPLGRGRECWRGRDPRCEPEPRLEIAVLPTTRCWCNRHTTHPERGRMSAQQRSLR